MTKPMFFIKDVTYYLPKNKAQTYVVDLLMPVKFQTLEDAASLERFERYLIKVAKSAHDLYPRTKQMVVAHTKPLKHEHNFRVQVPSTTGDTSDVIIITVATSQGEWKGGIL